MVSNWIVIDCFTGIANEFNYCYFIRLCSDTPWHNNRSKQNNSVSAATTSYSIRDQGRFCSLAGQLKLSNIWTAGGWLVKANWVAVWCGFSRALRFSTYSSSLHIPLVLPPSLIHSLGPLSLFSCPKRMRVWEKDGAWLYVWAFGCSLVCARDNARM